MKSQISILALFLLFTACGNGNGDENGGNENNRITPVYVTELQPQTFRHYVTVQGDVESDKTIMITPKTSATVEEILVKAGDEVKKGDILARCGNSGRSPEPHLHFQVQSTPHIGSKTMEYPLSHFISEKNGILAYHDFDFPEEGFTVQPVDQNKELAGAFRFLPGMMLEFIRDDGSGKEFWEVKADPYNNTYIECRKKKAVAYFVTNDSVFYFTHFKGNRHSLLYYFFLGAWKVVFHTIDNLVIHDEIPLHLYSSSLYRYLNDFIAPVRSLMRVKHEAILVKKEGRKGNYLEYAATVGLVKAGNYQPEIDFKLETSADKISKFSIKTRGKEWLAEQKI
jgi:hypothetical protein